MRAAPLSVCDRHWIRDTVMKIIITLATLLMATPVVAGTSADYGMGGQFARFDPVVAQYNQSGELLRIEGHCQSACTLFLSIKNVCVERGARLLFHAGHNRAREITATATSHLMNAYNASLRSY